MNKNIFYGILIVCLAIIFTAIAQYHCLDNKLAIPEDARRSIIWMSNLKDKTLFSGDILLDFEMRRTPIGLKCLYFLTGLFVDPTTIIKLLPYLLSFLLALYGYRIGCFLKDYKLGLLISFLMILTAWYEDYTWPSTGGVWFESGGAGDFHPIIIILFLFYLMKKDWTKSALAMLGAATFYPPLFSITSLTYVFSFIKHEKGRIIIEKNTKKTVYFLICFSVGLTLLFSQYFLSYDYFNLRMPQEEIKHMAEFYSGGHYPIFFPNFFIRILNGESGIDLDKPKIILLVISVMAVFLLKMKTVRLPRALRNFMVAAFFMFVIANVFLLKLSFPSMYMRYSLTIFLIIFSSVNLHKVISTVKHHKRIIVCLILLLIIILYMPGLSKMITYKQQRFAYQFRDDFDLELYEFISSLPKDAFLAAHPMVSDNIPMFSRRKVLIMQEIEAPETKSYALVKQRTLDFFTAYYSTSVLDVLNFCRKYAVEYLIIYKGHFSNEYLEKGDLLFAGNYYYAPFNEHILSLLVQNTNTNFAVFNLPKEHIIFEDTKYVVIKCAHSDSSEF